MAAFGGASPGNFSTLHDFANSAPFQPHRGRSGEYGIAVRRLEQIAFSEPVEPQL
jgi:hypothetical protein